MRKVIHVGTAAHDVLQALAHESGQTFQDLMDEAITDLLKKHKRPVTLKQMLSQSLTADGKDAPAKPSKGRGRRPA